MYPIILHNVHSKPENWKYDRSSANRCHRSKALTWKILDKKFVKQATHKGLKHGHREKENINMTEREEQVAKR